MNRVTIEQVMNAFEYAQQIDFAEDTIIYCCNKEDFKNAKFILSHLNPNYTAKHCHTWNGKITDKIVVHKDGRTSWTSTGGVCFDFWITRVSYLELYGELYPVWKNPSPLVYQRPEYQKLWVE